MKEEEINLLKEEISLDEWRLKRLKDRVLNTELSLKTKKFFLKAEGVEV